MDKRILSKKFILAFFFRTVMYQTLKCMQSHLYGEIKRLYKKTVFWVFFSMLGTKTINNMEVTLYGNPKQNYWKRVFSVFYVKNAKTDANRQIWRNRITLPKRYILSIFELVTNKKKNVKMDAKHSILGNKKTLRETCIMSIL